MKNENEEKYYQIGQVSKICNIPIKTLRYYDEIGLLKPKKVDSNSNYRYYSHDQLSNINTIKHFKAAGFSLKEIGVLVERNDLEYNKQMVETKCEEIEKNISELTILKNRLKLYTEHMECNEENPKHSIDIGVKEIPVSYVAYSRYKGLCNPHEFYLRFTKLNNLVEKNKLYMTGTMMAVYHDDYRFFDYSNADIEVCVNVSENEEKEGMVRGFGGFLAVISYHYGSYRTMNETYKKMLKWIENNGFTFLGGAIENYIIDVVTTICEDEYVTEIILPVKKNI
ncbi:MerR family transcriptional regulator [Wukongibacter baidiensis]|uniref:MerR family transcriptional regulator n=1 Tax=Wukongibacter baidiensis TaxID=1723361 RepID=UPI003D7F3A0E